MAKLWKNKLIYILMVAGLVWMYVSYVPFLMDYYVCRPEEGFFEFFQDNILSGISEFEGVLIALIVLGIFCLVRNSAVSVGIASLALLVLTHGSYLKYVNRNELLRLADLGLSEAAGMATEYLTVEFDRYFATLLGSFLLFIAVGVGIEIVRHKFLSVGTESDNQTQKPMLRKKAINCTVRIAIAVLFCVVGVCYANQFFASRMEMENADNMNLVDGAKGRYILYHFLKKDSLDNITIERVDESYEFLLAGEEARAVDDTAVKPNVIVIMNESWWNTDNADLSNLELSRDPMEAFKRLDDKCITGYLTSSVYGGGTVSSEAEFLTGINTKYYVGSSTIYDETMGRKLPSVVDYFNELDYRTVAIHPYYGSFYNREEVYTTMGFDEMVFDEDMENREVFDRYISDESLVKEIIERYEELGADEENKFIWSVSIANHLHTLEYHLDRVENYETPVSVKIKEGALSEREEDVLTKYINGIYLAGCAYEELIAYFEKKNEPVIIVMYGDHMPNYSIDALELLGLTKKEDSSTVDFARPDQWKIKLDEEQRAKAESIEMQQRLYSVPVIMWSNFELEQEPEFEGESIYYLSQMILESAGLPDSEMSRMLKYQHSVFRTNSRDFVLDAEGKQVETCTEEQLEMLNHGKVVIYDILFGEEPRENIWSPIISE